MSQLETTFPYLLAHLSPLHDPRCTQDNLEETSSRIFLEDLIALLAPTRALPLLAWSALTRANIGT